MKISCGRDKRIGIVPFVLLLWCIPFGAIQESATAQSSEPEESGVIVQESATAQSPESEGPVAIVANIEGEAILNSLERETPSKAIDLQGTLVYGDRITTSENSVLSMLVGEDALVCMDEFSELAIEQDANSGKLIQLVSGRACISTIGEEGADIPLTVQTPATTIRPSPGSLFSVEASHAAKEKPHTSSAPQALLTGFNGSGQDFAPTLASHLPEPKTEIVQVMQGSVEVVSQIPGVQPLVVLQGFQVTVRRGVIGQLVKDTVVQCQIQDLQKNPQHTDNSKEVQELIADQQSAQATYLVAALFDSQDPTNTDLANANSSRIINATQDSATEGIISSPELRVDGPGPTSVPRETRLTTLGAGATIVNRAGAIATTDLVQIVGPGAVEINTSTLTVTNSQVTSNSGTNGLTLVSVTSGGLLRGTSPDPVINITDSETTTQSAVNVSGSLQADPSLLEASAPLIAAVSTNPSLRSTLTVNEAIQINGGELVASIPADALIMLNGSTLSSIGSLISLSNGGTLAVNGNLVSLANGAELFAQSLVELSGGSSFALTNGSLLSSVGSNTVDISNSLCAGGGCINGFISAPPGNTINVANNFVPTEGVTVPAGTALIVVNGANNTVNLQ